MFLWFCRQWWAFACKALEAYLSCTITYTDGQPEAHLSLPSTHLMLNFVFDRLFSLWLSDIITISDSTANRRENKSLIAKQVRRETTTSIPHPIIWVEKLCFDKFSFFTTFAVCFTRKIIEFLSAFKSEVNWKVKENKIDSK